MVLDELPYPRGPLLDRQRAATVLERHGLNALVLTHPLSVHHATGYDIPLVAMRHSAHSGAIAIVPRDPAEPVGLVMPAPVYYARYAQIHSSGACEGQGVAAFQFSDPRGEGAVYTDRGLAPLDPLERARAEAAAREAAVRPVQATQAAALVKALRELGAHGGALGLDLAPGSPEWVVLGERLPDVVLQEAASALAELRKVKSADELALLRIAQRNTVEAAKAAARAAGAGASYRELRSVFNMEVARRGGSGVWMVVDRTITDAWPGRIREGQAFYIDCVSQFAGYHGDFGRTVSLGEPNEVMQRTTAAIGKAWEAIRERLRPGLRYREIESIGRAALARSGFDVGVRFTPHSVGLQHTDLPWDGELALEAGMVLSVDCPVIDTGLGGSAHREDMVLITPQGCELLNDAVEEVIVVPG